MIMSFASPLGVGLTSDSEYLDIEVGETLSSREAVAQLNEVMADGVEVVSFRRIPDGKASNAMALTAAADYEVRFREGMEPEKGWESLFDTFCAQSRIPVVKKTKKGERSIDIKPWIYKLEKDISDPAPFVPFGTPGGPYFSSIGCGKRRKPEAGACYGCLRRLCRNHNFRACSFDSPAGIVCGYGNGR